MTTTKDNPEPGSLDPDGSARRWNIRIVVPAMFILMDMTRLLTIQDRGHWLVILSVFLLPFWTVMIVIGVQRQAPNNRICDTGNRE